MAFALVREGLSSGSSAAGKHLAAVCCRHSRTETVNLLPMELLGLISSLHLLSLLFMHCAGTPRGECLPGLCIKTVIEGNVAPPGADSPSGAEVNRNKQNSCRLSIIPCAIQNVNKNRNDCYRLPRRAVPRGDPDRFCPGTGQVKWRAAPRSAEGAANGHCSLLSSQKALLFGKGRVPILHSNARFAPFTGSACDTVPRPGCP